MSSRLFFFFQPLLFIPGRAPDPGRVPEVLALERVYKGPRIVYLSLSD